MSETTATGLRMNETNFHKEKHMKQRGDATTGAIVILVTLGIIITILVLMFGLPVYSVWQQGLAGQAELKRAEQNRQISIQEATAKEEAAKHLARAEVERAKGVAESNKIIGDSLKGNEAYLRYLWVHALETTQNKVIYVPTEANLPVLEAGKR